MLQSTIIGFSCKKPKTMVHQGTAVVCLYHDDFFRNHRAKFDAIGQTTIRFRLFTTLENCREMSQTFLLAQRPSTLVLMMINSCSYVY